MGTGNEYLVPHLPIHGRGSALARILLRAVARQRLAAVVAAVVAVLASYLRKRAAAGSKARPAGPERSASKSSQLSLPNAKQEASSPATPKPAKRLAFSDLLRPAPGQKAQIVAVPEMSALVVTSLATAGLNLYKAWLMREFVTGQNLGNLSQWLKALAKFPFATLAGALLRQSTVYTQERVSLLWRKAATLKLMEQYFSNLSYYKLLHHGKLKISDPDVRICSDVKAACDALTNIFITGISGLTTSFIACIALFHRRGILAVALPNVYTFVLVPSFFKMAMPDFSLLGIVQKMKASYQQALTRIQLHDEGIAMLRGGGFEHAVLEERADKWADAERNSWTGMATFEWVTTFAASGAVPGLWQTFASFGAAFISLRAAGPGKPVLDPAEPNEQVVYDYGANLTDFWQVFYAVRGASGMMIALDNYKRSSQSIKRVEELQNAFAQLSLDTSTASAATFKDSDAISFDDVSVFTPTGMQLMAGLTFKVTPGRHLVICGHNGAGKSSIFRCLGGLWPVSKGTIACPQDGSGNGGLHGAAYYLPQRPANILGTLSDQLTYPSRVTEGVPEAELRRWLSYVQLEYLVDEAVDKGTLQEECDWGSRLSLGEQQRLGIARVLYHRPRFAILDECTSAVSKDMERWLFEVARELSISCVTITHRPALQEHHHQMLRLTGELKDDGKGWEIVDLPSKLPDPNTPPENEDEVHARIAQLLGRSPRGKKTAKGKADSEQSTSVPKLADEAAKKVATSQVLKRYPTALARITAALRMDLIDGATRVKLAIYFLCIVFRPQINWEVMRTIGGSILRAMCNDGMGLTAELMVNFCWVALLTTFEQVILNLGRQLSVGIWRGLALSLHQQALEHSAFHRVKVDTELKVENPMQRIAQTRDLLDGVVRQLQTSGGAISQMLFYLPLLIRGGGPLPLIPLVVIYGLHYVVKSVWMPNFRKLTARSGMLEDRLQVAQTRLRHVAESVAFSGGGDVERARIEEHFDRCCDHRLKSLKQEFMYNFLTEFFVTYDNLPIWFHRLLSFNFAWRNLPAGGASPATAVQNYLYDQSIKYNLGGVQSLASFPAEWAKIDGHALRVLELREALEAVPPSRSPERGSAIDCLEVKDLDLLAPGSSEPLAKGLEFQVTPGSPLLVTGPNGCGKTALARVLLGLWAPQGASAHIATPTDLLMVPQRPYLASGSLGDQVTYPKKFNADTDAERAKEVLKAVGIEYLLERGEAGFGQFCAWEEVLSGGEQQRLTLSRALFHRPGFAILDECTSMVAADAEEGLYNAVVRENITPLTLSQRLCLEQLHRHELRLGDSSGNSWSLEPIRGDKK